MLVNTLSAFSLFDGWVFSALATFKHHSASCAKSCTYSLGGGTAANSPLGLFHPTSSPCANRFSDSRILDEIFGALLAMSPPHFCNLPRASAVGARRGGADKTCAGETAASPSIIKATQHAV